MTDTFGNRTTRSCVSRAALRPDPRRLARTGAMNQCGASSNVPAPNTNMNPPLRPSRHSTRRMPLTLAWIARPSTSKRMTSPTSMPKRSTMPSSIDTSGSCVPAYGQPGRGLRETSLDSVSFGSSWPRYVIVYSRDSMPRPLQVFHVLEIARPCP